MTQNLPACILLREDSATLDETAAQEEAYGKFTSAHQDALTALMATPAPNWQASPCPPATAMCTERAR